MPYPVAIRIAWRAEYRHIDEWHYDQSWPHFSHDCYNFLRSGEGQNSYYYGYFPHSAQGTPRAINRGRIEDSIGDAPLISCPRVYWLAKSDMDDELCLVGWYNNAELLHREYRAYPKQYGRVRDTGELEDIYWRVRARDAFLIPVEVRPLVGDLRAMGFDPMTLIHRLTYLDDGDGPAREARSTLRAKLDKLYDQVTNMNMIYPNAARTLSVKEGRIRRNSERLERYGRTARFRKFLGDSCACCGFGQTQTEAQDVWSGALEVHHKYPVADLAEGDERNATAQEFLLLCATCHRAIHTAERLGRIKNLADVEGLRRLLPGECK